MFNSRSKLLFVNLFLVILHVIVLYLLLFVINQNTNDFGTELGRALIMILSIPHLIVLFFAYIFNIIAFCKKSKKLALTCFILYILSFVLSLIMLDFIAPCVSSFIICVVSLFAYIMQKRINYTR